MSDTRKILLSPDRKHKTYFYIKGFLFGLKICRMDQFIVNCSISAEDDICIKYILYAFRFRFEIKRTVQDLLVEIYLYGDTC